MKTLIISYFFPPCTDGASTLMYSLCKFLPKESYSVITTSEEFGIHYLAANASEGAHDKEYLLNCNTVRLPVRTHRMRDRIRFFLLTILEGLWLQRKREYDCLLAVYPEEFGMFAAFILHQLTRRPFVVYMHDLFSEVRTQARAYRTWNLLERSIFSSASAILVTNEKSKAHYLRRGVRNAVVLPSCVCLKEYGHHHALPKSGASAPNGNLRIVYTGSVYEAQEDAVLCFLEAAKMVKNLEIVFATRFRKDYLEKVNIGFLSKKECYSLQETADVLFLPLAFNSRYPEEIRCAFPVKALEYLVAAKPILAIVPSGSYMEEFIRRNEIGIVVTELSRQKVIDAIEKLKDQESRNRFSKNAMKAAPLYDARVQSRRLHSIIEHVVSNIRQGKLQ